MSNSILYRMPSGFPGDITRASQATVEPVQLDATDAFTEYGVPGKFVNGKFVPLGTDDSSGISGFLVRAYPATGNLMTKITGPRNSIGDALKRGYMVVLLRAGAAVKEGVVYVRIGSPTSLKPLGGIEAIPDGTNTRIVQGALFMGPADATGNVEISYKI